LITYERRKLAACLGTALLVGLCLWPKTWMPTKQETGPAAPNVDKVAHFALFACHAMLWMRTGRLERGRTLMVIGSVLFLAAGTELVQGLSIIGRDPDKLDCLADVLGGLFGVALVAGAGGALGMPDEAVDEQPESG
jgi:hypothetical protein